MGIRIYGDVVDINSEDTCEFYNNRAKTKDEREEYTTVLLGDSDPSYAKRCDEYEKKLILPKLELNKDKKILDLGCGIGRWATSVISNCKLYCGVDFSSEMINVAKEKVPYDHAKFINMPLVDAIKSDLVHENKYDVVIMAGVGMYINDSVLRQIYDEIPNLVNNDGIIYIEESAGLEQRLTLLRIWSESLNSYYNAIYRTKEEYINLLSSLYKDSDVIEQGYMEPWDKKDQKDTSHWYTILRYKEKGKVRLKD